MTGEERGRECESPATAMRRSGGNGRRRNKVLSEREIFLVQRERELSKKNKKCHVGNGTKGWMEIGCQRIFFHKPNKMQKSTLTSQKWFRPMSLLMPQDLYIQVLPQPAIPALTFLSYHFLSSHVYHVFSNMHQIIFIFFTNIEGINVIWESSCFLYI